MVTQVNLGSSFQSGNQTLLGGTASNIDTGKIVETLMKAKQVPIDQIQAKEDKNTKQLTALATFKTLLDKFKTASNFLRNPTGVAQQANDAFAYRKVSLNTNGALPAASYIDVVAAPGSTTRTSAIQVTAVAAAKVQTSDVFLGLATADAAFVEAASTANRMTAGTLQLKPGTTIALVAGDSLNTVANKINATSATSGMQATVIKVNATDYRLQTKATSEGTLADFDLQQAPNIGAGNPLENVTFGNTQLAANAQITVDGVTIDSQTNSISTAIPNVTFTVKQLTAGATVNTAITADTDTIKTAIIGMADAYNELRIFAVKQNQRDENGKLKEDSDLGDNLSFKTINQQIDTQLSRIIGGLGVGQPKSLGELGITLSDIPADTENPQIKNVLTIDESKLNSMLTSNPDGVRRVFAYDLQSSSGNIASFSRTNAMTVTDFTLDIDTTLGTASATYDSGGGAMVTVALNYSSYGTGANLTGSAGTPFEGLNLIYSSTNSATGITIKATQGLGDIFYNIADNITKQDTGLYDLEVDSLNTANTRFQTDMDRLNAQLESYRQQLLNRFAAMEAAIASVNTLLQSLSAQADARNNS